jgi:dipeptidyl-peptidase-4
LKRLIFAALIAALAGSGPAAAQGTRADYERADRLPGDWSGLVRNTDVRVRWLDNRTPVYLIALNDGTEVWGTVDLATGLVGPAFRQDSIARALAQQGGDALRIHWFDFEDGRLLFMSTGDPRLWSWDAASSALSVLEPSDLPARFSLTPVRTDRTSGGGPATTLAVVNTTDAPVRLVWLDHEARERSYATLAPGASHTQNTYAGHTWRVVDDAGEELGTYIATEAPGLILARRGVRAEPPPEGPPPGQSPNGQWSVWFRDHQVIRSGADGTETALTTDGNAADSYTGPVMWSPDSSRFVVMRTRPGDRRTVHIVESSPEDRLEPRLISFDYLKPGDAVDAQRPRLFDAAAGRLIEPDDRFIEQPWDVGDIQWTPDSSSFSYLYNARGHQTARLIAVDATNGAARVIVEETTPTFIDWTNKLWHHHLHATGEVLWMSERSGWNHLYLIDAATGVVRNPVTSGEWVVRSVERVDEAGRQVWLRVMGVRPGEDPYHIHHARVNLDGTGFTLLTEGDGTHRVAFSPDGEHLVDTWSRVDLAPVTEIRRASDGTRVAVLAEADVSPLVEAGWNPPERFVAKGRDGVTDIWGFIQKPSNFDPSRSYPVIESIYAGPHGQHVPKSFAVWSESRSLAELGFVVVHIDGMGTNWRSKAFHDVAFKNLRDAGFPDRIAWMKAAAAERPWMDLNRVGIYGVSAGGQNALGALLFHGDFYKAAVADCGCHDNRMDKIWWNEQWMGWPVDESYAASSNAEHAANLTGKLLLTVGELDQNVDPASTMQVVDALIKADKDFELIVFPGLGHGTIGSPYGQRRVRDFFVRSLHGTEPRAQAGPP